MVDTLNIDVDNFQSIILFEPNPSTKLDVIERVEAMAVSQVLRELRVSFEDDGSVRAIKGDLWQITTDEAGKLVDQKHIGTKNSFTEAELATGLPQPALLGQVNALRTERDGLMAERDSLVTERSALMTERDALKLTADNVPALTAERDAAVSACTAAQAQVTQLDNEKIGIAAERDAAKAQIIDLLGTPKFLPSALAAQLTEADLTAIRAAVTGSTDLWGLYNQLLIRAATGDALIPISSTTFLAGLAGLQSALGGPRVAELFASLNIDLVAGRYIQP